DLRHDLALDERADVPFALAEPARRAVLELGVDIALPQIRGLHDMHLGIDQPEAVSRHRLSSLMPRRYHEALVGALRAAAVPAAFAGETPAVSRKKRRRRAATA